MSNGTQQPLMFAVSDYNELNSLNSFFTIGRNLERINIEYMMENNFYGAAANDVDKMQIIMHTLFEVIKAKNNINALSLEYMRVTSEFIDKYKEVLSQVVMNPSEDNKYLTKQIEDQERFVNTIDICTALFNSMRCLVYNENDVHTVSLLTLMQILGIVKLEDEKLNYTLLKIVGRFNEQRNTDVDDWLETVEYDYELYYQKKIMDTINNFISLSPRLMLDVCIYKFLLTSGFLEIVKSDNSMIGEISEDHMNYAVNSICEKAVQYIESIAKVINNDRYCIPEYFNDVFVAELAMLDYYKVYVDTYTAEAKTSLSEFSETEQFTCSVYKPHYEMDQLSSHVHKRVVDYLTVGGFM
jgi:hypothetical protein